MESERYSCDHCKKIFIKLGHLRRHVVNKHKAIPCPTCTQSFSTKQKLESHEKSPCTGINGVLRETIFPCKTCEKTFPNKAQLKSHERSHSDVKPFVCSNCTSAFARKESLVRHFRLHTGERPYVCDKCDKTFVQYIDKVRHMRIHTGEKPYKCPHCPKAFVQASTMKEHLLTHKDIVKSVGKFREKKHVCGYCGKSFSRASELSNHDRVHTGEKPYSCAKCPKLFATTSQLSRHNKTHTGEIKSFFCEICTRGFTRVEGLALHMKLHTGERPYTCEQCNRSYLTTRDLKRHAHIKHPTRQTITAKQLVATRKKADNETFVLANEVAAVANDLGFIKVEEMDPEEQDVNFSVSDIIQTEQPRTYIEPQESEMHSSSCGLFNGNNDHSEQVVNHSLCCIQTEIKTENDFQLTEENIETSQACINSLTSNCCVHNGIKTENDFELGNAEPSQQLCSAYAFVEEANGETLQQVTNSSLYSVHIREANAGQPQQFVEETNVNTSQQVTNSSLYSVHIQEANAGPPQQLVEEANVDTAQQVTNSSSYSVHIQETNAGPPQHLVEEANVDTAQQVTNSSSYSVNNPETNVEPSQDINSSGLVQETAVSEPLIVNIKKEPVSPSKPCEICDVISFFQNPPIKLKLKYPNSP